MKYGFGFLAFVLSTTVLSGTAFASVKREGTWPGEEKKISLDVSNALKTDAVRRIAAAAGWNVVVHAPPGDLVDIHVKDLPPTKVLELVLNDGNYIAQREGNVVVISREAGQGATGAPPGVPAVPPVPAMPPIPPIPPPFGDNDDPNPDPANGTMEEDQEESHSKSHHGKKKHHGKSNDRIITGGSARVEKGDVVDDLVVMGGSVEVYGEVRGDLVVMGGSATVYEGGHILGDVSAIGGKVRLESGACVDGEVGVVGGLVDQQPGARVGSDSTPSTEKPERKGGWTGMPGMSWTSHTDEHRPWYKSLAEHVSNAVEHTALLFVLGAVLLSLATRRMDLLRMEIAARPMRSFAIGILATLATVVGLVALCVTVIGIPIAIVGVLVGAFGIYAGICAALATLGKGLVAHRTENQHVHLAVGCAVFLILSALPLVGWITVAVVGLIGFGALVATRLAGFAEKKSPMRSTPVPGEGPYRSTP
ncbi:hypothetical protein LVJ94_44360 [Pendulispora rubella]|uniref:DUF8173 domain-containing protein n=1 Tax=Pendulispora rubella TaxID=2741070 RepID=A0ABZ2L2Z4_9BACT